VYIYYVYIGERRKRKNDFQKSTQLDPSLIAILKAYNVNLPAKILADQNAISKDIKQIIQEKKIVIELSKP
jgi:hypothetical protein